MDTAFAKASQQFAMMLSRDENHDAAQDDECNLR
jgi:hypothetical protein